MFNYCRCSGGGLLDRLREFKFGDLFGKLGKLLEFFGKFEFLANREREFFEFNGKRELNGKFKFIGKLFEFNRKLRFIEFVEFFCNLKLVEFRLGKSLGFSADIWD